MESLCSTETELHSDEPKIKPQGKIPEPPDLLLHLLGSRSVLISQTRAGLAAPEENHGTIEGLANNPAAPACSLDQPTAMCKQVEVTGDLQAVNSHVLSRNHGFDAVYLDSTGRAITQDLNAEQASEREQDQCASAIPLDVTDAIEPQRHDSARTLTVAVLEKSCIARAEASNTSERPPSDMAVATPRTSEFTDIGGSDVPQIDEGSSASKANDNGSEHNLKSTDGKHDPASGEGQKWLAHSLSDVNYNVVPAAQSRLSTPASAQAQAQSTASSKAKSAALADKPSWHRKLIQKLSRRNSCLPQNVAEANDSVVSDRDAAIFTKELKPHIRALLQHKTKGMRQDYDDSASCELVMMHYNPFQDARPVILFTCVRAERQKQIREALKTPALQAVLNKFGYPTVVQVDSSLGLRALKDTRLSAANPKGLSVYGYIGDDQEISGTQVGIALLLEDGWNTKFCTLGGVILVGGRHYGLTCSHMLARSFMPGKPPLTGNAPSSTSEHPLAEIGTIAAVSQPRPGEPDYDWLLIDVGVRRPPPNLPTTLWSPLAGGDQDSRFCSIHTPHGQLAGRICPGETMLEFEEASYDAVRIEVEAPLPEGHSGSWVVLGDTLFGVVIAGRDYPPTAYALRASTLFQDISMQMDGQEVKLPLAFGLQTDRDDQHAKDDEVALFKVNSRQSKFARDDGEIEEKTEDDLDAERPSTANIENNTTGPGSRIPVPEPPDGGLIAWLTVLASFITVTNFWGIVMAFGSFQAYYEWELLTQRSSSTISWIGTVQWFLTVYGAVSVGYLLDMGYLKTMLTTGAVAGSMGMLALSFCDKWYQVFLSQGILMGIGAALIGSPSIRLVSRFFTKNRLYALSLTMCGQPIGGIMYTLMFQQLIGPKGFAWTTRIMALVMLISYSLAVPLLYWAEKNRKYHPLRIRRSLIDLEAFRDLTYCFHLLGHFIILLGYSNLFFYASSYGRSVLKLSLSQSLWLLIPALAGSILGRIITVLLVHKRQGILLWISCASMAGTVCCVWVFAKERGSFIALAVLYGLFSGGLAVLPLSILPALCPNTRVSKLTVMFGMTQAIGAFATLIGAPIGGSLIRTRNGNVDYLGLQIFSGATILLGGGILIVLWLSFHRKRRARAAE